MWYNGKFRWLRAASHRASSFLPDRRLLPYSSSIGSA
nr:MAG TPA: hypothetical protein [Caudoviricetes sp.]